MSEEQKRILRMLSEGKITVEEAEQLLDALGTPSAKESAEEKGTKGTSSWNRSGFGDMFGEEGLFGKKGLFGEEMFGTFFGEKGPFSTFFGAKCGTGETGRKSAKCSAKREEVM